MFKITKVDIIPTQAGRGLRIRDFEIGCARIVEADFGNEYNDTNDDFVEILEKTGLSVGCSAYNDEEDGDKLLFDKDLSNAKNYVLVKIDNDGQVYTINTAMDICHIFDLPESDADMLDKYIGALANDRQLVMGSAKDDNENPIMFFTNKVDAEITKDYINGELEDATKKYFGIMSSADYRAEYISDNFIKMFLIAIITSSQDRYNKVHRDETLREIANMLMSIDYWHDGQLCNPSILDIENYINDIKSVIRVK